VNLTRREFMKIGGAVALSLAYGGPATASRIAVPVLMYHDLAHELVERETVTPSLFAAQMEWLYSAGYSAISFSELGSLDAKRARQSVIITFDDGDASFMDYAYPLLSEYRFKATMNIIGNAVGKFVSGNDPRLSWDECRLLLRSGMVELGCHTYGLHSWYGNRSRSSAVAAFNEKLARDLALFQKVSTAELGRPARILAWPYGMHDRMSIEIAKQSGFHFILNSENQYFAINGDPFDIPRLVISNDLGLSRFRESVERRL
jgi:peptidoglycan/xylan/chitin deacetylase (PgdA/CDA1 family)